MDTRSRRRIVVGVDGSPAGRAALAWATAEARRRGVDLWLVWVLEPATRAPYAGAAPGPEDERASAARQLRELTSQTRRQHPRALPVLVHDRLPARGLAECARGADLLVVGAVPREPPSLGPVATSCLGMVSCPLVVVEAQSGHREQATAGIHGEPTISAPRG